VTRASEQAADRARITATVRAYATAIDLQDFALLRSVVTDPILIDFTSWDPRRAATSLPVATWIDGLRPQLLGLDATLHTISDPRIAVDGDEATSVAAMRADHHLGRPPDALTYTMTGHYTDTLIRDGDGWRISAKVLNVSTESGPRQLMAAARHRGIERLGG
jgi:ketosteroid isomerase-like protein